MFSRGEPSHQHAAVAEQARLLIYGAGNHLLDMLAWHPELSGRIARLFDKNPGYMESLDMPIEPAANLAGFPAGTYVVIAAIKYFDEIAEELSALNSGLVFMDIDEAYDMVLQQPWEEMPVTNDDYSPFVKDLARRLREAREAAHEACL